MKLADVPPAPADVQLSVWAHIYRISTVPGSNLILAVGKAADGAPGATGAIGGHGADGAARATAATGGTGTQRR
ncbi:MAG: hypothetical protein EXR68_02550 [Dehalococcoidia bacterium]|nr:hypothetical protein [Dehalococcoidia bacterium]